MKQLPLCVGIICVTAIIITAIVCKVSLETIFDFIIGLMIIAFAVANLIDLWGDMKSKTKWSVFIKNE